MQNLDAYLDKFSEKGKQILEFALNESQRRNQNFISPEHILYALTIEESELFDSAMKNISLNPKAVRLSVEKRLENGFQFVGVGFRIAPQTTEIFKLSMERARSENRQVIDSVDIFSVFTNEKKYLFDDILENPEGQIHPRFGRNFVPRPPDLSVKREMTDKERELLERFHEEQKKFLSNISWEDVIKNNKLISELTALGGGGGSGSGGGGFIGDEIKYTQHSSTHFSYKTDGIDDLKMETIISSLKTDVASCLKQNQLRITKIQSFATSFVFEYEMENLTGKINISGKITQDYFQLSVNSDETSIRKK